MNNSNNNPKSLPPPLLRLPEYQGKDPVHTPILRFTPTAWAKLIHFCHKGDTEIGGFGITPTEDLLVEEFATVKQAVSVTHVAFDDAAVADFFESQVERGRKPSQFARIWLHTHPGDSPVPSGTDEQTFDRVFGACDWAVMFILARGGATYARLRFNHGPGAQLLVPCTVDYSRPFGPADVPAWDLEYQAHVHAELEHPIGPGPKVPMARQGSVEDSALCFPEAFMADLEAMEPEERRFVLDELAERPDLWSEEEGVLYG